MIKERLETTRRDRLNSLIRQECNGNRSEFANKYNLSANSLGQVIRGDRPFGEKIARKIEYSAGLWNGYLDTKESDELLPALATVKLLPKDAQWEVFRLCQILAEKHGIDFPYGHLKSA